MDNILKTKQGIIIPPRTPQNAVNTLSKRILELIDNIVTGITCEVMGEKFGLSIEAVRYVSLVLLLLAIKFVIFFCMLIKNWSLLQN